MTLLSLPAHVVGRKTLISHGSTDRGQATPSGLLDIDARIATLSDRGIYVLQQRIVKHYTRLDLDIPTLAKETAPVLWEMHQQRDWLETVYDDESDWTTENLRAEETAFDAWLREGNPSRRTQLNDDHTHSDLRKAARTAALARRDEVAKSQNPRG